MTMAATTNASRMLHKYKQETNALLLSLQHSSDESEWIKLLDTLQIKDQLDILQALKLLALRAETVYTLKNLIQLFIRKMSDILTEEKILNNQSLASEYLPVLKDFWALCASQHYAITGIIYGTWSAALYEVLPSLASIYIDLFIASNRSKENATVLAKRLYGWLNFELSDRCMKAALLEASNNSRKSAAFLLPVLRKVLSSPPPKKSALDYLLHFLVLRRWSLVFGDLSDVVQVNLNVKAPKNFVDWLCSKLGQRPDYVPQDKSLKGRHVSELLCSLQQQDVEELIDVFSQCLSSGEEVEGEDRATETAMAADGLFLIDKLGSAEAEQDASQNNAEGKRSKKRKSVAGHGKSSQEDVNTEPVTVNGRIGARRQDGRMTETQADGSGLLGFVFDRKAEKKSKLDGKEKDSSTEGKRGTIVEEEMEVEDDDGVKEGDGRDEADESDDEKGDGSNDSEDVDDDESEDEKDNQSESEGADDDEENGHKFIDDEAEEGSEEEEDDDEDEDIEKKDDEVEASDNDDEEVSGHDFIDDEAEEGSEDDKDKKREESSDEDEEGSEEEEEDDEDKNIEEKDDEEEASDNDDEEVSGHDFIGDEAEEGSEDDKDKSREESSDEDEEGSEEEEDDDDKDEEKKNGEEEASDDDDEAQEGSEDDNDKRSAESSDEVSVESSEQEDVEEKVSKDRSEKKNLSTKETFPVCSSDPALSYFVNKPGKNKNSATNHEPEIEVIETAASGAGRDALPEESRKRKLSEQQRETSPPTGKTADSRLGSEDVDQSGPRSKKRKKGSPAKKGRPVIAVTSPSSDKASPSPTKINQQSSPGVESSAAQSSSVERTQVGRRSERLRTGSETLHSKQLAGVENNTVRPRRSSESSAMSESKQEGSSPKGVTGGAKESTSDTKMADVHDKNSDQIGSVLSQIRRSMVLIVPHEDDSETNRPAHSTRLRTRSGSSAKMPETKSGTLQRGKQQTTGLKAKQAMPSKDSEALAKVLSDWLRKPSQSAGAVENTSSGQVETRQSVSSADKLSEASAEHQNDEEVSAGDSTSDNEVAFNPKGFVRSYEESSSTRKRSPRRILIESSGKKLESSEKKSTPKFELEKKRISSSGSTSTSLSSSAVKTGGKETPQSSSAKDLRTSKTPLATSTTHATLVAAGSKSEPSQSKRKYFLRGKSPVKSPPPRAESDAKLRSPQKKEKDEADSSASPSTIKKSPRKSPAERRKSLRSASKK